jgi:hypothetical protein
MTEPYVEEFVSRERAFWQSQLDCPMEFRIDLESVDVLKLSVEMMDGLFLCSSVSVGREDAVLEFFSILVQDIRIPDTDPNWISK